MSTLIDQTQSTRSVLSSLARSTVLVPKQAEDAQTRFLTLLTTQLRNQDPLNPLENAELTSQLAQLNMVDGIERLNGMFQTLLDSQQSSAALQAANLVGRGVLVPGRGLALTDSGAVGGFELDRPADRVLITISDAQGQPVRQLELGPAEAGSHVFLWDGLSAEGQPLPAGNYSVSLTASAGDAEVSGRTLQAGVVSSVIRGAVSTDFQVGSLGIFTFDDIKQIL
ncbi:MAG: flagellar hook assembly protein FlgD [Sphingobacteriia bacterium]|nr:flagellar hook assembly protein FlgD [Sphingobacteriia bacterium]NCC38993.1 flagellar hook assembly protein FlgD [Gammaproteobacteria bacterium]